LKTIQTSSALSLSEKSASSLVGVTEEGEMNMTPGEPTDATVDQGPELPLPVPDLL